VQQGWVLHGVFIARGSNIERVACWLRFGRSRP
jgi:hypothetical protein